MGRVSVVSVALAVALVALVGACVAYPVVPLKNDYSEEGPFAFHAESVTIVASSNSTGCDGTQCELEAEVMVPLDTSAGPFPLAIISPGFQMGPLMYMSYGQRLASWGYVAIVIGMNDGLINDIPHDVKGRFVLSVMEWADQQNSDSQSFLYGAVDATNTFAQGHSLGGKSSVLAASLDKVNIKGVFAIDPVDCEPACTFPDSIPCQYPPEYPSAARASSDTSPGRIMIIGAQFGNESLVGPSCAPEKCSQRWFFSHAPAGTWHVEIMDGGHNQFVDIVPSRDVCPQGEQDSERIHEITRTLMAAWAEHTIRGVDIAPYLTGPIMGEWLAEGRVEVSSK